MPSTLYPNCKCGHAQELHFHRKEPTDTSCTVKEEMVLVAGGERTMELCDCKAFEAE